MDMSTEELVDIYAESWRKLDADIIAPYLAEDFTYSSMWVFQNLGRDGYIDYLKGKYDAIRRTGGVPSVAKGRNSMGIPSVILKQGDNPPAYITVTSQDGKITKAYMLGF